jgi:hypothetical protein
MAAISAATPLQAQTVQVGAHALTLRDLGPQDGPQLMALHRQVFGPEVDAAWLAWKYGQQAGEGHGLGCGVWHGGELIAHCGGLPRTLWRQGRRSAGIQIGDVMVSPPWRGILTRRGPFFHASQAFYERQVGAARPHQVAYGFPSERHLRLAVTLKLLWDGGPIHALTWHCAQPAAPKLPLPWRWRWHELSPGAANFDTQANRAWATMHAGTQHLTLGQRDATYLRWRYVHRPGGAPPRYRFFTLHRPWTRAAAGVAVLGLQGGQAQWLDWVGPLKLLPLAAQASRWQAAQAGAASLNLWASPLVAQQLAGSGVDNSSVTAWLGIPRASTIAPPDFPAMNWWLMGGDTDFL